MQDVTDPDAAMGPNHYVVVWDRMNMGITEVVTGQLYTKAGTPIGIQFEYPGRNPTVAIHSI